jgi:outer membrane protein assembly factor BamB
VKKLEKTKSNFATISLILTLIISASIVILPIANAHDPPLTIDTYAYISAQPNPIGVGQTAYLIFWIDKLPPTATGPYGVRWHNFEVTVTKPDGDTEILGPFNSDQTGGAWSDYHPDQIGTYQFQFTFPGQVVEDENPVPDELAHRRTGLEFIGDTFKGSTSEVAELVVQQDPVESSYPPNPFPTEYWERPIHSMNRNWYSLGGNWLGLGLNVFCNTGNYDGNFNNFNPYTTAPNSAHVLWTKPAAFGGQIGGEFGEADLNVYATGTAYEPKIDGLIIYGILYYTEYTEAGHNPGDLKAVDLRTGEELWSKPMRSERHALRCGMVYNFITGDQYGGHAYLFSTNYNPISLGFIIATEAPIMSMYDATTGEWILDIANPNEGLLVTGSNGEILSYIVSDGMLTMWNMSKCIEVASQQTYIYAIYDASEIWRPPQGETIDWNGGIEWSVPVSPGLAVQKVVDGVVLVSQSTDLARWFGSAEGWQLDSGYDANTGELLWGPINRTVKQWTNNIWGPASERVYTTFNRQAMTWYGYSIITGEELWGPTEPYDSNWGYFDAEVPVGVIGYGNLYSWSFNGEVHCYDVNTGIEKWDWSAGSSAMDSPYGIWPFVAGAGVLADGKFYVASSHDYTPPLYKGAKLYCIDAYTGEEMWSTLDFSSVHFTTKLIADGILVTKNSYDNLIYAYGKGSSKTTVTVQDNVVPKGESILITGKVTDESPGTKSTLLTSRFPNGVPAIADEYMSAWMEYLYQQQPRPDDATGVTVKLEAVDPNNEYHNLGTTISDPYGNYGFDFKPEVEGKWMIIATFEGTDSYYSSTETTYLKVDPAPTPETPITPEPEPEAPLITTELAIVLAVVAVAVIGVVGYWLIKKK